MNERNVSHRYGIRQRDTPSDEEIERFSDTINGRFGDLIRDEKTFNLAFDLYYGQTTLKDDPGVKRDTWNAYKMRHGGDVAVAKRR